MSYCRFGEDSDVYMLANLFCGVTCCSCRLNPMEGGFWNASQGFLSPQEALEHLQEHKAAGHLVPQYAIERLRCEAEESEDVEYASPEEVQVFTDLLVALLEVK